MRDGGVDAVTCSMALQVLAPLPRVLAEVGRVLRPGGQLVATVPARRPLRAADVPVLAGLLAALGRRIGYPNDEPMRRLPALLRPAGLVLVGDQHRRFAVPLRTAADADLVLASLYLPDLPERRRRAARAYLHALARARASLPLPIRRVVARRHDPRLR
jgi:SAM-dependent methyltransferase